jgi:hypothetical protein
VSERFIFLEEDEDFRFTRIPNDLFHRKGMTANAFMVLTYALRWHYQDDPPKELTKEYLVAALPMGKAAIANALEVLEELGYHFVWRARNPATGQYNYFRYFAWPARTPEQWHEAMSGNQLWPGPEIGPGQVRKSDLVTPPDNGAQGASPGPEIGPGEEMINMDISGSHQNRFTGPGGPAPVSRSRSAAAGEPGAVNQLHKEEGAKEVLNEGAEEVANEVSNDDDHPAERPRIQSTADALAAAADRRTEAKAVKEAPAADAEEIFRIVTRIEQSKVLRPGEMAMYAWGVYLDAYGGVPVNYGATRAKLLPVFREYEAKGCTYAELGYAVEYWLKTANGIDSPGAARGFMDSAINKHRLRQKTSQVDDNRAKPRRKTSMNNAQAKQYLADKQREGGQS